MLFLCIVKTVNSWCKNISRIYVIIRFIDIFGIYGFIITRSIVCLLYFKIWSFNLWCVEWCTILVIFIASFTLSVGSWTWRNNLNLIWLKNWYFVSFVYHKSHLFLIVIIIFINTKNIFCQKMKIYCQWAELKSIAF